jgi:hypothetical protein
MKRTLMLGLAAGLTLSLAGSLATASAALAQTAAPETNSPVMQGEPANQTPEQNQKATQDYNSLVSSNPGFKNARMHKECDSIEAADLKQQCMASFGAGSTGTMGSMGSMGSSAPKR